VSADKSTAENYRPTANAFIAANSQQLAQDLLYWRRKTQLKEDALFHELASICLPAATADDHYQIAENLLLAFIIRQAAGEDTAEPTAS